MAGLRGKSGPPGNMNAFKHGLAAIQKRREESITTEHEESVRQQILEGLVADAMLINVKRLEFGITIEANVHLTEKGGNVARDRIELPTRGFSVLLPYRDYVSPSVIN
jgi:hypothetical protein